MENVSIHRSVWVAAVVNAVIVLSGMVITANRQQDNAAVLRAVQAARCQCGRHIKQTVIVDGREL